MSGKENHELKANLPLAPVDFEIMLALNEGAKHGYGIIRDVEERSGGAIRLGTSTLYAAVRRLLRAGFVADAGKRSKKPSGGPPRRNYRLTPAGRRLLRLEALRLQNVAAAARERVLEPRTGG